MSFEELRKGLLDAVYYRNLGNNYCGQILFEAADLKNATSPDTLPMEKARMPTIRAISDSGGFSSITKAFIKPSIPFEVEFNGKSYSIPVMTLMHPSPVRVENIQHDAMLTLGDPNEGNNSGLVILVPLVGSLTAGASGAFIAKVTRYLSGILTPNPATGQYESIDIPTGSDWNLSSILPGAPGGNGKTFVTNPGYYVWSARPPLTLRRTRTVPNGSNVGQFFTAGDTEYYEWGPTTATNLRYIMLSEPVQVNSLDLQTIRMLPATPTTEALSPMEKTTLSYRTAGRVGPNGQWIASCSAPPSSAASAAASIFGSRETMENQCDPFAPGNFPSSVPTKDEFVKIIIGALVTFGTLIAIYFAVKLWTQLELGRWFADKGEAFGTFAAQVSVDLKERLPVPGRFKTSPEEKAKADAKEAQKQSVKRQMAEEVAGKAPEKAPDAAYKAPTPTRQDKLARAKAKAKAAAEADKARAERDAADFFAKAKEKTDAAKKEAEAKAKEEAEAKAKEEAEAKAKEEAEAKAKAKEDEAKAKQAAAAGTGLFTPEEQAATRALEQEAKREEDDLEKARKAEQEAERLRANVRELKALFAKAKDEKEAREAEARKADEAEKKARERAEIEAKDLAETQPVDARRRTQFGKTVVAPKVPAAIISEKAKAKDAERAAAKAEAEAKASADAAAKELAEKEAEIKRRAEEAAASASKAVERQTAKLPIASKTVVKEPTGETTRVEDPRKVLDAYATAIKDYESSRPEDHAAAYDAARALEATARQVSLNSPTLKTRYQELVHKLERIHGVFSAPPEKTPQALLNKLFELEGRVKRDVNNAVFHVNSQPIVRMRFEKRVTDGLDLLMNRLTYTSEQLKQLGSFPALERLPVEKAVNRLLKYVASEREAQKRRAETKFTPPVLDGKGRRRKMKRKSTRRYVA